jgi:hypothetical protein
MPQAVAPVYNCQARGVVRRRELESRGMSADDDRLAAECFGTAALTSWAPLELGPIVAGVAAGEIVGPVPELMARSDGVCLLYPGKVHEVHGEPETGKGWLMLNAAKEVLATAPVLYVDCEDSAESIVERLLALGTPPEVIVERFDYVRPDDPFTPEALADLLDGRSYALAVIDGVTEAYGLLGLDLYGNADAAKFLAALPRPIAETGAAVVLIDHVVKSKEARGRYGIGAGHKLAGITVTYSVEALKLPSRTDDGLVKIKVEKDRPGHVRSHAEGGVVALARIEPSEGGRRVNVTLDPPDSSTSEDGTFRPTVLMGRVARHVEDEPGATQNGVRKNVEGKRGTDKDLALRRLVDEGFIERRQEGRAWRHYSVHPFDENAEPPTVSQCVPSVSGTHLQPTVSVCPSPVGGDTGHGQHNGHADLQERVRAIAAMTDEQEQAKAWQELEESSR